MNLECFFLTDMIKISAPTFVNRFFPRLPYNLFTECNFNKSSSAAELAASSNLLGLHGSVLVSTLIGHHQLQNLLPRRTC